jgi:hypothetical protein
MVVRDDQDLDISRAWRSIEFCIPVCAACFAGPIPQNLVRRLGRIIVFGPRAVKFDGRNVQCIRCNANSFAVAA